MQTISLTHIKTLYIFSIKGFIFPIVSHWEWAKNGWLYDGPSGLAFKVI